MVTIKSKFYIDENGSVLIFSTAIILIMLMLAFLQIVIGFMFRDQILMLDALDSAVTASLAPTREEFKNTYYYEKLRIEDTEIIDGIEFPTEYRWVTDEGYAGNYIRLKYDDAYNNADCYFNKNLQLNGADYDVLNFDLKIEYDDERWLPVVNTRAETRSYPIPWWQYEIEKNDFEKCDEGIPGISFPNQLIYVRFPRWVKVTINTTVEMPIPFGIGLANMLRASGASEEEIGDESNYLSIKRSYVSSGIKELKEINPPPIFAWE